MTAEQRVLVMASLFSDACALIVVADILTDLSEGETVSWRPAAETLRGLAGIVERIAQGLRALHDEIVAGEEDGEPPPV